MTVDRRLAKQENKKKTMIEAQRLNIEDVSEDEALDNQDLMDHKLKLTVPYVEGHDAESSGDSDASDEEEAVKFVNPLLAAKTSKAKKEEPDEEWSDEGSDEKYLKGKKKGKKTLLGKRDRKDKDVDNVQDFFKGE